MEKKSGFISVLFMGFLLLSLTTGIVQAAPAPIVLKLGNIQAPNSSASIACERMAKLAAMEGPFDTLLGMKFYEPAPNISLTNHLLTAASVSINDKKFTGLPKDLQDILVGAAKDAGDYFSKMGVDS